MLKGQYGIAEGFCRLMTVAPTRIGLAVALVFAISVTPVQAEGTLADAIADLEAGRYSRTMSALRPLAEAGDAEARVILAGMLLKGQGAARDVEAGRAILEEMHEKNPRAAYVLGEYHYENRDGHHALPYLLAAADADDPRAMVLLGRIYEGGRRVDHDRSKSERWFTRAIEYGSDDGWATFRAGMAMLDGRNPARGAELLEVVAAAGNLRAMVELGRVYAGGSGVARDDARAEHWLMKTAEAQYPPGELLLGDLYQTQGRIGLAVECYGAALLDARTSGHNEVVREAMGRLVPYSLAGHLGVEIEKPDGPCRFDPSALMVEFMRSYLSGE